mmetsp:Transcript_41152/g.78872  ORF Transcript_41152/g.78872 Transcript_41152/m.78872 type:complete len:494 (+) Transcript_41152:1-1482(+)
MILSLESLTQPLVLQEGISRSTDAAPTIAAYRNETMKIPILTGTPPRERVTSDNSTPTTCTPTPPSGMGDLSPRSSSQGSFHHSAAKEECDRRLDFDVVVDPEADPEVVSTQVAEVDRVYWEAFLVNMPMFCGYSALFSLQHEVKTRLGISDSAKDASGTFCFAVSFVYIFNLIFRVLHNFLFGFLTPRQRAMVAMFSMMGAMFILAGPIFAMGSQSMSLVMVAYALGGVGMGTFEGNFLCCLTPLGPRTKHVAITAVPVGITLVSIGGFVAMGPPFNIPATGIYVAVAVAIFCGMIILTLRIPSTAGNGEVVVVHKGLGHLMADARAWRQWLPLVWHLPLPSAIDMFMLAAFSPGVALYIWDKDAVSLMPGLVLPTHSFFALFNLCNLMGGVCGRILSYRIRKPRHPLYCTLFSITGAVLLLMKVPMLAFLSNFLIMVGDGLIYGLVARCIDEVVPKQYNLIAISYWLFLGDFGSVAGSNLVSYIRIWVVGA